jgi:cardiolipin synthase
MTGLRPSPGRPDWLTIPNAITLLRLALIVPVCIFLTNDLWPELTLVLLVVFGVSDWADGFLARRLRQTSKVGAVLDPIADRIGVAAIILALVASGHLDWWVVLVVVGVDIVLLTATILVRPPNAPPVSMLGKARTVVLMAGLALVALGILPSMHTAALIGEALTATGAALHAAAGVGYLRAIVVEGGSRRRSR